MTRKQLLDLGICLHCQERQAHRARGLCVRCYDDKAIREQYPKLPNKPNDREPTMEELDALIAKRYQIMPKH